MKNQKFTGDLRHVIGIIFIRSGRDKNCIGEGIARKNFIRFCRKICSRCMIQRDGRDMKSGNIDEGRGDNRNEIYPVGKRDNHNHFLFIACYNITMCK